jgi:hypothetical protein
LPKNKINNEKHWFKEWITEGLTIRRLSHESGYSSFKLHAIKNYWLAKEPPKLTIDYSTIKHVMIDATYFKSRKKKRKKKAKRERKIEVKKGKDKGDVFDCHYGLQQ